MAMLNIEGRKVTVDDSFLKLSPDEQNATVEEIASTLKPSAKPDIYEQAAIDDQAKLKAAGLDTTGGYTSRIVHGLSLGADTTVGAALATPIEMYRRGTWNPAEGYNYAKAAMDLPLDQARKTTGGLGTAAELLGGAASGVGLARAGLTFGRMLAPEAGLVARSLASAGDAAALGGFSGGMEGNNLQDRLTNATTGAVLGGAVGGATPAALSLGGGILGTIMGNLSARNNPAQYAQGQVARALAETGRPVADITGDVGRAAADGQGMYTLADAMGNPGQRMLSTVARSPGQGRTDVVDFLDNRQAGQSRRVANALAEGFDSPQTAEQTRTALTNARGATADAEYSAVRNDAVPVDVSNVVARIDDTLAPGVNRVVSNNSRIAPDSAEAALQGFRDRLTDGNSHLTDFAAVQRVRGDLSDAVQAARQSGAGNKARLLGQALRELDTSLENASQGFRDANANFAQASRNIDAIDTGRNAAMRGRTEDIIPEFRGLNPDAQGAYRAGYADPLIQTAQGSPFGTNAARPLTSTAFRDEAAAIAPMRTGAQMQNRIARENTMFQTRNQALGGSRTADNLADEGAMEVGPQLHFIAQVTSGNIHGAVRTALQAGSNHLSGNTPEVRQEIARLLLQRSPNLNGTALQQMVDATVQRAERAQAMARNLGRGVAGAAAVESPRVKRKRN